MKKKITALTALLVTLAMLVCLLGSCASGSTLMTLGKQKISRNLFELYLSRQKGTLCTTYYYGSDAKADSFWDTTISVDGTTYNDYWTSYIAQCVKVYLAALYLFEEEYKLTLPEASVKQVDEIMAEFVTGDGDGSKSALNKLLSAYGVNYNMLREAYIIEKKVEYLQTYLYGADLSKVSEELKEQYYNDNYVRFKQVFFMNYRYVYDKDSNGDTIYYDTETDKILYDSSTGIRRFDDSGRALTDEHGTVIYYREDGSIAYDEKNGQPSYKYDSNGNYLTEKLTSEELRKVRENADDIAEFTKTGDTDAFESYIEKYSEDTDGQSNFPNGYYFATNAQYSYQYIIDIISALLEMQPGEIRVIESDFGYHVVMKYELDSGAYAKSENDVWFESEQTSFTSDVKQWLFTERCKDLVEDIEINEDKSEGLDMKAVEPNFYY